MKTLVPIHRSRLAAWRRILSAITAAALASSLLIGTAAASDHGSVRHFEPLATYQVSVDLPSGHVVRHFSAGTVTHAADLYSIAPLDEELKNSDRAWERRRPASS